MSTLDLWFARPAALASFAPILFLWWYWRKQANGVRVKKLPEALARVLVKRSPLGGGRWPRLAMVALLACIALSIADPIWSGGQDVSRFDGSTWIVAVDLNEAVAGDEQSLHALQSQVDALILQKSRASVALLVLAGSAHWVLPPTQDTQLLRRYLYSLDASLMPEQGASVKPLLSTLRQVPLGGGVNPIVLVSSAEQLEAYAQELNDWNLNYYPVVTMDLSDDEGAETTLRRLERLYIGVNKAAGRPLGKLFALTALLLALLVFRNHWPRALVTSLAMIWLSMPASPVAAASGDVESVLVAGTEEIPPPLSLFLDMWLTRDQQGYWLLRSGENLASAQRFDSSMGRAVAWYRLSRFRDAAEALQGLDTFEAKFLEGNAWAHSRDYRRALLAYEMALQHVPAHPQVVHNMAQIKALVALAAEQGEAQQADMGDLMSFETDYLPDEQASLNDQEVVMLETIEADRLLSDPEALRRWRSRVESSPQRFLANRFRQEWLNDQPKREVNE